MKRWVEWLLSIALLLLVVAVIVALVVGFVRWFRPSLFLPQRWARAANHSEGEVEEGDSAGLEFDLGTPDQSTLLRRRQIRRRPSRRYAGTATNGDFYKLCVRP